MKSVGRMFVMLMLVLVPAVSAAAQSTPEAVPGEPTVFARGFGEPATYVDARGNPVFSITVAEVERDWQDYDEYSAPERGSEYVLVQLTVTNLTARPATVSPYTIVMVDSLGMVMEMGYIYDDPEIWMDDITLDAGETVEGAMVFQMYTDVEPMILMWQPEYGYYVFVYLGDESAP